MKKTNEDIAKMVIDEIGKNLENDIKWDNGRHNFMFPQNPISGTIYKGINVFSLSMIAMMNNYKTPRFVTFKQASEKGGHIIKGEKGSIVVFWKMLNFKNKVDPDKMDTVPLLRYYRVFNIDQIEGLPEEMYINEQATGDIELLPSAEELANNYLNKESIDIVPTYSSPFYSPVKDVIGMPELQEFKTAGRYYESLFHEMIHSTGHKDRLKREFSQAVGEYSREELIAEYGAAMLLAQTGSVEGFENLAAYIKGWWKRIKSNPKDLIVAAGKAEKAMNYVVDKVLIFEKVS